MSKRFLFVGEQPSLTAYNNGWMWKSGRLAAATLFHALRVWNIHPEDCGFVKRADMGTQAYIHGMRRRSK